MLILRRSRLRGPLVMSLVFGVLPWLAISPAQSRAQNTIQAALERRTTTSPEKRAELYRQLRQQAAVVEAQSAVVKLVAKLVGPAVVHITADTAPHSALQVGGGKHLEEAGSGVIVQWDGKYYVLTSRHVIRGASRDGIRIKLADGRRVYPDKIWDDTETDVAVLAITASDLVPGLLGNSDAVEIGDFVLAMGSPFGLSQSVTYGIISAKGRRDLKVGERGEEIHFQDFLQTDAAINPGNSGGPLINLRGEVIAINTAIASSSGGNEGVGFAIPMNMFVAIAKQLVTRGVVTRAFMGVNLNNRFGPAMAAELGLPRPMGALVDGVTPDSPAALAKLQAGDVILEFDNVLIEDDAHLINLVSMTTVGKQVPLTVFRDRQMIKLQVEVSDRAKFVPVDASRGERR